MGDSGIVERHFAGQAEAVLGIPARVMGGVHPALAALPLGLAVLGLDGERLVVGEQHHVRPLLDERRGLGGQLHLPAVVCAELVRLLKFPHLGVRRHDYVHAALDQLIERIQQAAELLHQIGVALAVAELLDALFLCLVADVAAAQQLRPVHRVDDERAAQARVSDALLDQTEQHHPAGRLRRAGDVHVLGAALGVDEQRIRELCGKRRLADALRTVHDNLERGLLFSADDLH